MSSLEHAIPERFFNNLVQCNEIESLNPIADLPTCPRGISSVSAIAIAEKAGQKIYNISQEVYEKNPDIVDLDLNSHSQSTKESVRNALNSGQEVLIHQAPISQDGWTGAGYVIVDPATGGGGYFIEGGSSGGWYALLFQAVTSLFAILMLVSGLSSAAIIAPIALSAIGLYIMMIAIVTAIVIAVASSYEESIYDCGPYKPECNSIKMIERSVALLALGALYSEVSSGSISAILPLVFQVRGFFDYRSWG